MLKFPPSWADLLDHRRIHQTRTKVRIGRFGDSIIRYETAERACDRDGVAPHLRQCESVPKVTKVTAKGRGPDHGADWHRKQVSTQIMRWTTMGRGTSIWRMDCSRICRREAVRLTSTAARTCKTSRGRLRRC